MPVKEPLSFVAVSSSNTERRSRMDRTSPLGSERGSETRGTIELKGIRTFLEAGSADGQILIVRCPFLKRFRRHSWRQNRDKCQFQSEREAFERNRSHPSGTLSPSKVSGRISLGNLKWKFSDIKA